MPGFQNGVIAETGKLIRDANSPTGGESASQTGRTGIWVECDDGTDSFGMYNYAGSPESNLYANIGSFCLDTTNGDIYKKSTDNANTGWIKLADVDDIDTSGLHTFDDFLYGNPATTAWALGIWTKIVNYPTVSVATAGRIGVLRHDAGAESGVRTSVGTLKLGTTQLEVAWWVKLPSMGAGDFFRCGIGDSTGGSTNDQVDGVYFEATNSSANWRAKTASTSTRTDTDTSTAYDTNWVKLGVIVNSSATSVGYYIDDSLVATVTTNIPTADLCAFCRAFLDNGVDAHFDKVLIRQ